MKRVISVGVLAFLIGVLVSYLWIPGKQAQVQEQVSTAAPTPTEKGATWVTVADGVRALRLWETVGPEWPQVAVLRLSSQRYGELRKNPKALFDEHKIFPQAVQPLEGCVELEAAPRDYAGDWMIAAYHRLMSRAQCAAFPAEATQAK